MLFRSKLNELIDHLSQQLGETEQEVQTLHNALTSACDALSMCEDHSMYTSRDLYKQFTTMTGGMNVPTQLTSSSKEAHRG